MFLLSSKRIFNSKFLAGSPQYLTLWRILLTQQSRHRVRSPGPNLCVKDPPTHHFGSSLPLVIRWDAGITWAKVWSVAKISGVRFQNCIVCGRHLITEAPSSAKWSRFQLDIDGLLYSHLSSLTNTCTPSPLNVGGLLSPGQRKWLSGGEPCVCGEVAWSPRVKVCALLTALVHIHNIAEFVSGCFGLRVN